MSAHYGSLTHSKVTRDWSVVINPMWLSSLARVVGPEYMVKTDVIFVYFFS